MAKSQVQFEVTCQDTQPGEKLLVVGSAPELGAWKAAQGLVLATDGESFPKWRSSEVSVDAGKIEFKLVIQGGGERWENGQNKSVQCEGRTKVCCNWGSENVVCTKTAAQAPERAPEEAGGYAKEARPEVEQPKEEEGVEVALRDEDTRPPMQKSQSRHLFRLSDGSLRMDMTKTPSLMMMDLDSFMQEAEAEQKHVDELEERERLNQQQRKMASGMLLQEMAELTDEAEASEIVMLQGFNWESHKAGKGNWYGIVESKVEMFAEMGITDIWLPPCSQSVAPQGYLPSQLFNLDASAYGKKDQLKQLLKAMRSKGIRGVADIVINHRCGDQQDEQGRWNVFTTKGIESRKSFAGVMDWQGWAITLGDKFSDGTGERGPGQHDQQFDAAPDIDHGNQQVQKSIAIWLRWLRLDVGFDAWRFDFVKGYGAEYVGLYCKKSHPAWAVGELWLDMRYDDQGLSYDQNEHRQNTINWINATDKESTAFDFTTKGILQEACRNCQYWRLKDPEGKPPGLLGWLPSHAVTFLDNHDTGSTQAHWPFPGDKVLVGYAYILTHPGIPSIFWDHVCDWGDDMRQRIATLLKLRKQAKVKVNSRVTILCADADLYIAEIGEPAALRVALGPRSSGVGEGWKEGASGGDYKVWISNSCLFQGDAVGFRDNILTELQRDGVGA